MSKPAIKLVLLAFSGTALFFVNDLRVMAVCAVAVMLLYPLSSLSLRKMWQTIRPALVFLIFLVIMQGFLVDWVSSGVMGLRFVTLILLASWVTLTTPFTQMIEVLVHLIKPFTKSAYKISFVLLLTWRFIPLIGQISHDVREAHQARNAKRRFTLNPSHAVVPVLVRTLTMGDTISQAMDARGFESSQP